MAKNDILKTALIIGGVALAAYVVTRKTGSLAESILPGGISLTNAPMIPSFPFGNLEIPGLDEIEVPQPAVPCGFDFSRLNLPEGLNLPDLRLGDVGIVPGKTTIYEPGIIEAPVTHLQIGNEGFMIVPQYVGINEPLGSFAARLAKQLFLEPFGLLKSIASHIEYGSPVVDFVPDSEYFPQTSEQAVVLNVTPEAPVYKPLSALEFGEREAPGSPEQRACYNCPGATPVTTAPVYKPLSAGAAPVGSKIEVWTPTKQAAAKAAQSMPKPWDQL